MNDKYATYYAGTNPPRRRCKFRSWGCSGAYGLRARDWRPFEGWPRRRGWRRASPATLNYLCSTYCFYPPSLLPFPFLSISIAISLYQRISPTRIYHFSLSHLHSLFLALSLSLQLIYTFPSFIRAIAHAFSRQLSFNRCEMLDVRVNTAIICKWSLYSSGEDWLVLILRVKSATERVKMTKKIVDTLKLLWLCENVSH